MAQAGVAHIMRPPSHPGPIEDALQRAAFAMQTGQAGEAERITRELMKNHPGDPRVAQLFSYALILNGRGEEAIAPLERLLRHGPNSMLETQLAMALRQAGRKDDALACFVRATSTQPPFPPAFLEYGGLLIELDRCAEAAAVLEQGLAVAPNLAELALQLGMALARQGEREKARAAFARAMAGMPPDTDTLFLAARTMQDSRDFAQAAKLFERMLAIDSTEIAARVGLGICLLELGQNAAAFDNLRAAANYNARMFGQTLKALTTSGRGRFWLRLDDAARALKTQKT